MAEAQLTTYRSTFINKLRSKELIFSEENVAITSLFTTTLVPYCLHRFRFQSVFHCMHTPAALLPTVATPVLVVFPKEVDAFSLFTMSELLVPSSFWRDFCLTCSLVSDAAAIMLTVDCCKTHLFPTDSAQSMCHAAGNGLARASGRNRCVDRGQTYAS